MDTDSDEFEERMDTGGATSSNDASSMETSEPHGSSSTAAFDHANALFHPDAFQHNCVLTVEKHPPKYIGCHDLDCLLHAVAHGVSVASIEKLPGDGLPRGVYQVQLSCRKDVPTPNLQLVNPTRNAKTVRGHKAKPPASKQSTKKDKKAQTGQRHKAGPPASRSKKSAKKSELVLCQRHNVAPIECQTIGDEDQEQKNDTPETPACTGFATFNYLPYTKDAQDVRASDYVKCPRPEPLLTGQKHRQEHGVIKFKIKPQLKTVYNPAIWTRKRLEEKCEEAFQNAMHEKGEGEYNKELKRWCGPFRDDYDDKKYWFEGYYKVIKEGDLPSERKQISSFYFIHPDTLEKRGISTN